MKISVYIIAFFFSVSSLFGTGLVNHFSLKEVYDFNAETVFDIKQDATGTMWFGTNEGLISFDGLVFKTYLAENHAISYHNIKFDDEGGVWCSNFGGQLFRVKDNEIKLIYNASSKGNFIYDYLLQALPLIYVIESNDGEIISFNIDTQTEEVVYTYKNSCILTARGVDISKIAIITKDRINSKQKITLYNHNSFFNKKSPEIEFTLPLTRGKSDILQIQNSTYFYDFLEEGVIIELSSHKADTLHRFPEITNYNLNNVKYCGGYLWVLTKTGAKILPILPANEENYEIEGINTSTVFQDKEGTFWVGTLNRGIYIVPNLKFTHRKISNLRTAFSVQDNLGNIYVNDDAGNLFLLAPPLYNARQINIKKNDPAPLYYSEYEQKVFIGNQQTYFDINKQIVTEEPKTPYGFYFKQSQHIDSGFYINTTFNQSMIVSTTDRKTIPKGMIFDTLPEVPGIIRPYRSLHVTAQPDSAGIYVDYIDGLYFYGDTVFEVKYKNQNINVSTMMPDFELPNAVWAATKSKRLHRIVNGEIRKTFDLNDYYYRSAGKDSLLFLAGSSEILCLNIETGHKRFICESAGLKPIQIKGLHIHSNDLIIIGNEYVQILPLDYEIPTDFLPEVSICHVVVNGEKIDTAMLSALNYTSNNITFSFSALSARAKGKFRFKYRLRETDSEPVFVNHRQTSANFINLKPGTYSFEVAVCDDYENCSQPQIQKFTIAQPFYFKWWFIILAILILGLAVYYIFNAVYNVKTKQIQLISNNETLQKDIYRSKIAAIRSQMNPHFMFNALNTIQEFIITNQQDIAGDYLADFADLMRIYLKQSNQEEVTSLKLYLSLEKLRFNNEFEYNINVAKRIDENAVKLPVMLLQPYVENSIKHGLLHKKGMKKLDISFQIFDTECILCVIEDNGIGREAAAEIKSRKNRIHESFATDANINRIDLINHDKSRKIKLTTFDLRENNKPKGTRVEIILPVFGNGNQ